MCWHAHQAHHSHEEEQRANRREAAGVAEPLTHLVEHAGGSRCPRSRCDPHRKERGNHGDVAHRIDEKAPPLADGCDEDAGRCGAEQARGVDHGGVERDGVGQVRAILHHLDDHRLARGHVEGVDKPLKDAEGEDVPDIDHPGEGKGRERARLDHCQYLGDQEDAVAIPAVDEHTCERGEDESRDLPREAEDPKEQRGSCQPIDEPRGSDAREPRTDEGDALAAKEEAVVAVTKRAADGSQAGRRLAGSRHPTHPTPSNLRTAFRITLQRVLPRWRQP